MDIPFFLSPRLSSNPLPLLSVSWRSGSPSCPLSWRRSSSKEDAGAVIREGIRGDKPVLEDDDGGGSSAALDEGVSPT